VSLRLHTIIASTRPGRVGPAVAKWAHEAAVAHGGFDAHLVDLADFALPVYNEPNHPRLQKYEHGHTRSWAESVAAADAYVFVTPEYNFGPTPALLNALNYVYVEWGYKPAAFVSYGGVSGGMRAVQMTKLILTTLKVVPLLEGVVVPMVAQQIKDGAFVANDLHAQSVSAMLNELQRWASALKPMRTPTA